MDRDRTFIGGLLLLAVGILVIGAIWYFVLRPPAEASAPIESVPLELPTTEPMASESTDVTPTEAAEEPAEQSVEEGEPNVEANEDTIAAGAGLVLYEINQDGSEVRFILNEELRGQPTTVLGITNQVAGQIAADYSDLSSAQVGVITINARTLATDNDFRNNAIHNRILNTNQYEFITFAPTAVNDLPASIEIGETITFEIAGNLTIRDVTNEETFSVTATPVSAEQLSGSATTQVLRSDYNLQIPNVPNVANVSDQVQLEIDFIANAIRP